VGDAQERDRGLLGSAPLVCEFHESLPEHFAHLLVRPYVPDERDRDVVDLAHARLGQLEAGVQLTDLRLALLRRRTRLAGPLLTRADAEVLAECPSEGLVVLESAIERRLENRGPSVNE
jgi:hypothetical protein